ncbi:outer membrane lipoprotein-sorting protein [Salidesulfovibrio onnuriiensis]|uniref:outer membrane lipoprotein-sorting protein n=1 Tax=Salidesulfovibrio onnuriiensis TaxID=2583823 RepID=UPI0011CB5CF4|nr:outer membrane lipoprotein-sorting protein [Salidesulfovibrio onnuriiensis]
MHRKLLTTLLAALAVLAATACQARAMTADEIVRKANHAALYQGATCKGTVTLRITDAQGRVRKRELNTLRKDMAENDGAQHYMTYFKAPADVRKMVFLVHKTVEPGKDDDRWLYMPSMDLVKRIAAGDKRTSFAGSDFLYEDISGRNIEADVHEQDGENQEFHVIRNTPKDPGSVEFSHYLAYIDKTTYLPMRVEYFKNGSAPYRIMEALRVEEIVPADAQGGKAYPTVTESRVSNLETGSTTVMTFTNVQYDIPVKDAVFGERYLRRPPREVMR